MKRAIAMFVGLACAALATADRLTAAPYVQLGEDDQSGAKKSLTIVWHVDRPTGKWSLRARTRAGAADVSVRSVAVKPGHHWLMRATVANLEPGERVEYLVVRERTIMATGVTQAPKADQPISVAVIGDCGRNSAGQRKVASQIFAAKPDLVVITGDDVYPNGRMSEYGPNLFTILNSTKSPVMRTTLTVAATGNHDTAYRDLNRYPDGLAYYAYWKQPLNGPPLKISVRGNSSALDAACDGPRDSRANFSFDDGPAHWTVIDSNTYVDWRREDLRKWLTNDLRRTRKRWKFVVFHHPPFHSSIKHQGDVMMRVIVDVLSAEKVDLVLCGHVHNYQRTFPMAGFTPDPKFDGKTKRRAKGPIYLVSGAGGGELYDQPLASRRDLWKPYTAAYTAGFSMTLLDVNDRRLLVRQVSGSGAELDRFQVDK